MRSPFVFACALILVTACGEVAPLAIDATPTCSPACGEHATCGGTTCTCDTGWEGDGQTCTDVNECMTNNGGCDPNAACFNNDGGRNCGCNTGFVGDGMTCRRVWEPRGSAQIKLTNIVTGQTNDANVTAVGGNRIYFAPDIGSNGDPAHFMRYFDISTMQFNTTALSIPPAATDDFCACGYTEVFVGTSTDIYMFGNYGQRYNAAGNTWSSVASYTGSFQRGESAGALEANNGIIYMIGGRGDLNTAQRFTPTGVGTFGPEPGTLPFGLDSAAAWAPAGGNVVYVAGGYASDNNRQHLLSHATGTTVWTSLPDAPLPLGNLTGMGDWQGKLWVTTRTQMFLFDLSTNMWRQPISLPGGFAAAVTVGTRTFALIQGGDTLEVHELMAIE